MSSSNPRERPQPGEEFVHFKGMRYRVIGVGRHSETLEEMVFYEALYDNPKGRLWARPLTLFQDMILATDGTPVPRFQKA